MPSYLRMTLSPSCGIILTTQKTQPYRSKGLGKTPQNPPPHTHSTGRSIQRTLKVAAIYQHWAVSTGP